ncbi:hypothetical protein [Microbacterium sp. KHB019]|uniref:hypothetical protein n=1 Tax=Microbacterium sp. KHB019 TaxID=3129770 RepID=UPI00307A574D
MNRGNHPAWMRRWRRGASGRDPVEKLARALAETDAERAGATLHPRVILTIDSGGEAQVPPTPMRGRNAVAFALVKLVTPGTSVEMASINGASGVVLRRGGVVVGVVTSEIRAGYLRSVWVVCNPQKLRHWNGG